MVLFAISVFGTPAPQGSKTRLAHGAMVESSKKVGPWRDAVRAAALGAIRCCDDLDCRALRHPYPLTGPVAVRMVFSVARPQSHYRTGRNAHLLRDGAPVRPGGKPDLSKYLRSSEDALTDAYVYKDDGQIVEYDRAAKVFCGEDPEALDAPGALIVVRTFADPAVMP